MELIYRNHIYFTYVLYKRQVSFMLKNIDVYLRFGKGNLPFL